MENKNMKPWLIAVFLLSFNSCVIQPLTVPNNRDFTSFEVSVFENGELVEEYEIKKEDSLFGEILEVARQEGERDWFPASYAPNVLVMSQEPYLRLNFSEDSVVVSLYSQSGGNFDQKIVWLDRKELFESLKAGPNYKNYDW
tara:strand:+ start:1788 stop:2213 length:426 start_codon:yes stop_codon:yes gene_type:complete